MPEAKALQERPWHAVAGENAIEALHTDGARGLSDDEAESRLQRYSENKLPEHEQDTILKVFVRQFKDPLIYVLCCSSPASVPWP